MSCSSANSKDVALWIRSLGFILYKDLWILTEYKSWAIVTYFSVLT